MKSINTHSDELFKFFVKRMPEKHVSSKMKKLVLEPYVKDLAISIFNINTRNKTNYQSLVTTILKIEDDIVNDFINDKNFTSKINNHKGIVEQIESNRNKNITEIKNVIDEFIKSEKFVSDFEKLKIKKLKEFTTWITQSNNTKAELDNFRNKINELFSKSVEDLVSSADFQQDRLNVYNSILSLGLIDTTGSTLRDILFTLAKTINFIELLANNDSSLTSEKEVVNPLDTEILFPSNIFEDKTSVNFTTNQYKEFEMYIAEKKEIKVQVKKLKDLRNTKKSLSKLKINPSKVTKLSDQLTISSKTSTTINENITLDTKKDGEISEGELDFNLILTKEEVDRLDYTVKNTLKEENIPLSNISISRIIPQIGDRVKEINHLLYPKIGKDIFKSPDIIIQSINDDVFNRIKIADPVVPSVHMGMDTVTADLDTIQKFPPFVSGIGDLKKVKDKITRYSFGEIAHVENILTGEFKERTHKKLTKTEETITIEEKTTEDITNHLESTERFELKKTSNEVIETENKIDFGVKITAGYGPFFEASSYFDMGIGSSTKESNDLSSTYSKNVIDKSISKIQRVMSEKRVTTITQQIEETNTHKLDNTARDFNVHGIYQWLDKIYCGELYVYDKRLLLEFIIPDPARFYRETFKQSKEKAIDLKNGNKQLPPQPEPFYKDEEEKEPITPEDITDEEYMVYASWYDAEVTPPPSEFIFHVETFKQDEFIKTKETDTESVSTYVAERKVPLPQGYKMIKQWYKKTGSWNNDDRQLNVHIRPQTNTADQVEGTVGIIISTWHYIAYAVAVYLYLERTANLYHKWQYETWLKIHEAYLNKKALYDSKISEMAISEGIEIVGNNPLFNRETEKVELKKGSLMMLTNNHLATSGAYYKNKVGSYDYPHLNFATAKNLGRQIQFFEQSIEWHNILYVLYSYFWGKHTEWVENLFRNDIDPLFSNFLKAGAARVVVPVRPGFEKVILYFLKTKIIWEGKDVPLVNEPMYLDIVEEMKEKLDLLNYDGVLQDSWEYKVPTSLVYLRNSDLSDNEDILPSWEGCSNTNNDDMPSPEG